MFKKIVLAFVFYICVAFSFKGYVSSQLQDCGDIIQCFNDTGKILTCWSQKESDNWYVYSSLWDGANFTTNVLSNGVSDVFELNAKMDKNGNVIVAWIEKSENYKVKASYWNGSFWSSSFLSNEACLIEMLKLDINSTGKAVVCWSHFQNCVGEFKGSYFDSVSTWTPQTFDTQLISLYKYKIKLLDSGVGIISWGAKKTDGSCVISEINWN